MTRKKSGQAKVHDEMAVAKAEFVPSTGDEDYLRGSTYELDEQHKSELLEELKEDINDGYDAAMGYARSATGRMIEVGKDILKARSYFKGDNEFGKWRKENINFSGSHCTRLMSVAREFGDNTDALALPVGTLSELCSASPALKEKIVRDAAAGKPTTRAEVTKAKKAEKPDSPSPEVGKSSQVETGKKPQVGGIMKAPPETPEERADKWLALPVAERIAGLEVRGRQAEPMVDAFLMFGIPPFHEGMPSLDTIHFLWHAIAPTLKDGSPELMDKFTAAYEFITDQY